MRGHCIFKMFYLFLYFAICLSFAVSTEAGASTQKSEGSQVSKNASISHANADTNNETRNKRTPTPIPQPKPQLLLPGESEITKRQFMPIVPEMPRRDFLPRREFEAGSLLPTPRLIRPLEMEHPGFPIERNHFIHGPLDLERRPLVGQGLIGPPLLPEFRRLGIAHRPLFREVGPPLVPLSPELEPKHIFLGPHRNHFLNQPLPHLAEERSRFGSLGDTPLLPIPHRHHLSEGFMAPEVLPEGRPFQEGLIPEVRHRFGVNPRPRPHLGEGLLPNRISETSQLRHRLQELEQLSRHLPETRAHPTTGSFADSNDASDDSSESKDGDDSIESMMNELNKHKSGKAWVTDVNIYDKKRKNEDLGSFLETDDKDDDDDSDFGEC